MTTGPNITIPLATAIATSVAVSTATSTAVKTAMLSAGEKDTTEEPGKKGSIALGAFVAAAVGGTLLAMSYIGYGLATMETPKIPETNGVEMMMGGEQPKAARPAIVTPSRFVPRKTSRPVAPKF